MSSMSKDKEITRKLIFVSLVDKDYSRSGVYFSGLHGSKSYIQCKPGIVEMIRFIRILRQSYNFRESIVVVMSPSHYLVLIIKLTTRIPIVLDAGWPLTDAELKTEQSRFYKLPKVKNYLIDFFSFHFSKIVIFETEAQCFFSSKKFWLHEDKCKSLSTGFNEIEFKDALNCPIKPLELSEIDISLKSMILFRGKNNKEAGIEKIVEAAERFGEKFTFLIVSNKKIFNLPSNVILINRFISSEELVWIYQNSSIVLGQFGDSSRLNRTIPHKFFEAAFFRKCYITPENSGLYGYANSKNVLFSRGSNPQDIYEAINYLEQNHQKIEILSQNLNEDYNYKWRQSVLSQAFYDYMNLIPQIN